MKRIIRFLILLFVIMFFGLGIQINYQGKKLIELSNKAYAAGSGPVIGTVTTSSTSDSVTISGSAAGSSILDNNPYRFSIGTNTSGWMPSNSFTANSTIVSGLMDNRFSQYNSRRIVRLGNGWFIAAVFNENTSTDYFYKSTDNGTSWTQLSYCTGVFDDISLACVGNTVYAITGGTSMVCYVFDATIITNSDMNSSQYKHTISGRVNSLSYGCSIAIASDGTIHAAWTDIDYGYRYNDNIRYSKSTDGGATWCEPIMISDTYDQSNDYNNMCPIVMIKNDGNPIIIWACNYRTPSFCHIKTRSYTGQYWDNSVNYIDLGFYVGVPSVPSAIIDNRGIIHVVWSFYDSNSKKNYLYYSYSANGGLAWSSRMQLTDGSYSPTLTYDKNNNLYVIFSEGATIKKMVYNGTSWGPKTIEFSESGYPGACVNYTDFVNPIYIYNRSNTGPTKYSGSVPNGSNYIFSGLLPNTKYVVTFEAKDSAGTVTSKAQDVYTKAVVPGLSSKALSALSLEVDISDTNPASTEYQVKCGNLYVSSTGQMTSTPTWITLPDKKITLTGLSANTQYIFQAKARNAENIETSFSNITSCSTFAKVSGTPQNLTLISEENVIKLVWDEVEYATGYDIEADGNVIDNGSSTSYQGTYEPGIEHNFRIRAKNDSGPGEWSYIVTGKSKFILPAVPTNLKLIPAGTSISVSWDSVTGTTGYDLEVDGQIINSGIKTTYKHSPLKLGTQHTYRVRSKNSQGVSAWSSLQSAMTTAVLPSKPNNLTYKVTNTTVTINWDAATDAESYDIVEVVNGQDGRVVDNGSPTTCEKRGLVPSSTHTYKIRAVNSIGAGEWSDPITITTFLLDTPSDIVTIESDTSIFLGWTAVKDATSYVISINGTETTITTNVFTFTKLTPETKYTFRVKAVGANGESSYSDLITTATTPIKPAVPKNVNATVSDTLITVTWDKVESAEGYDVELDGIVMEDDDDNIYIHDGLESDTMHTYRVRARNSAIEGDWSDLQYIKTLPGKPVVPKNIEIRSTTTGVTLTWQGKDSDLSYDIKIYDGSKKEDGTPTDPVIIENIAKSTYTHRRTSLGQEYTYWIRTRNKEGVSDWSGKIINNAIKAKCTKNKTVDLGLTAKDVTDFSAYTMVVTYNASAVDVIDLSTLTGQFETVPGRIEGTDIEITDFTPGKITFKCDKVVNPGEAWTGVINSIKFKARATGGTTITYTVFCKQEGTVD